MKRDRKLLPGNGVLALAGILALGVGFVFAQPPTAPDAKAKVEGKVDSTVETPPAGTPRVNTEARTRTGAAVQTPDARTNVQGNVQGNVPGAQGNVQGNVQGDVRAPGVQAGGRTQAQGNINARTRAGLGFQIDARNNQGLRISGLQGTSAAAKAGFRQNDRIVSIDGRTFTTAAQLRGYLAVQGGRRVPVIIHRGGQQFTIELPLDERPSEGAWLGVNLDEEGSAEAASVRGARIARIYPTGPAAQAGLYPGDVITAINNQPVAGATDVVVMIQEMQPQSQIEVAIQRQSEQMKVPVVLGDRSGYLFQHAQGQQQYQGQFAGMQNQGYDQNQGYAQGQGQAQGQQGRHQTNRANSGDNDIPPYAMQLESERRNSEQHERIEDEIRQLREEVKKLRELLEKK